MILWGFCIRGAYLHQWCTLAPKVKLSMTPCRAEFDYDIGGKCMKLVLYDNINKYMDDVMDIVSQHEIQNNLIISNCLRGKNGVNTANWFMAAVKDAKGIPQLVALMTPPHNLLLYELDNISNNEAVHLLTNEVVNAQIQITGVLAERSLAERFSNKYSSISGKVVELNKNMRIYRLDKVNDVSFSSGKLQQATQQDLYYLPYWNIAFTSDCGMGVVDVPSAVEKVKRLLNDKTLYIWKDDVPVSQAAMGRRTLNGAVVNAVYTPPHYRGKGYATSCVASLSQHLLDQGNKFCSLFTDLANPISNSIYMKIGYKPVCDYDEYMFKET